jgi:citrate synthase
LADLIEVPSGLDGVIAFDTSIAEPDRAGSALRYRGVDIEELVGRVPFQKVWGLLVDGSYEPGLPPAQPQPLAVRTGDARTDLQAALAMLAPEWGLRALIDISDNEAREDLARVSVMALSFVAQSARGVGARPSRSSRSTRHDRFPSAFCCAGAARRTRATSRRSTRTGSPLPSTA